MTDLIAQLRSGALTPDEFAAAVASEYHDEGSPQYPETDRDVDIYDGVNSVTMAWAVADGDITQAEADAVYALLPVVA